MKQEEKTFKQLREVAKAQQTVRNIIAAGTRQVQNLINDNTSKATIQINQDEGEIIKYEIT